MWVSLVRLGGILDLGWLDGPSVSRSVIISKNNTQGSYTSKAPFGALVYICCILTAANLKGTQVGVEGILTGNKNKSYSSRCTALNVTDG